MELQASNMKIWKLWAHFLRNREPLGQLQPSEGGIGLLQLHLHNACLPACLGGI